MQIDRLNHLKFPTDTSAALTGKEGPSTSPLTYGRLRAPNPAAADIALERAHGQQSSTVLQLKGEAASPSVYSNGRPSLAQQDDDMDVHSMSLDHQLALERTKDTFTQLTVRPDGVMVAKQHSSVTANQPEFVTLAVTAMRDFADAAERNKKHADLIAPIQTEAHAPVLHGLQKLAARLNVFA